MEVKEVALAGLSSRHSSLGPSPQGMGPLSGVCYCEIGTDTHSHCPSCDNYGNGSRSSQIQWGGGAILRPEICYPVLIKTNKQTNSYGEDYH